MTALPPRSWRVREAGAPDVAALALVGAATFLDGFAGVIDGDGIVAHCRDNHSEAFYRESLQSGARAWLAEIEPSAAPVGYALLARPDLPGAGDGDIELKRIYLLSRFHGSGIAKALLDAVDVAAKGYARMVLGVYRGNDRALGFYRKHGFVPIGERRFTVGAHSYEDHVLARFLNP